MLKEIIIPLGVGIAIFFFGLEIMRIGLNRIAGKKMEEWLSRFTKTPLLGFITGMIATSIVQSSSAITVITVGLVNARLLTYRQSIGIVLGSNVGTAVTVQLIALSLDDYVVPLIFIGLILWLIPKPTIRFTGLSIGGFSLLFIGLKVISTIAAPIANQPGFQAWFASMGENLMLSVLIGTSFYRRYPKRNSNHRHRYGFRGGRINSFSERNCHRSGSQSGHLFYSLPCQSGR